MPLPYESATSGDKARGEISRILRRFGCESVGFMDEFSDKSLILAFKWRGRNVQLRASAQGWANTYLKEKPWNNYRRSNQHEYEEKALNQGMIAVNSILRDWVKGQVTAVETGILTFEEVFVPHMLASNGKRVMDLMMESLPALEDHSND